MKKIIVSALVVLSLASCGQKKIEKPEDALLENQKAVIDSIDKLANYTEKGESKGKITFDLKSKQANANGNLDYDVSFDQEKKAFKSDLALKFDADINAEEKVKINGETSLKLVSLAKKIYFQVSKFDLNAGEKEDMQIAMMKAMVVNQVGKWISADIPEQANRENFDSKEFFTNKNKVVKILKKYPVFKVVKENENKDFYDYDVVLNEESIAKIAEEINKEVKSDKKITKEDIEKMKEEIKKADLKGNIKIDKKDFKYYELTLENKEGKMFISNLKDSLKFSFTDPVKNTNISFDGKKSGNKITGTLTMKEDGKEAVSGDISFEKNGSKTSIELSFEVEKEGSMKIKIEDETKEKSVKIEAPKGAVDIKEVMGGLGAGMGTPGMPAGGAGIPAGMPIQ